jgi:TatD DNase family protein
VRGLADLREVPDDQLAASAGRNAERVFGLAELPPAPEPATPTGDASRSA